MKGKRDGNKWARKVLSWLLLHCPEFLRDRSPCHHQSGWWRKGSEETGPCFPVWTWLLRCLHPSWMRLQRKTWPLLLSSCLLDSSILCLVSSFSLTLVISIFPSVLKYCVLSSPRPPAAWGMTLVSLLPSRTLALALLIVPHWHVVGHHLTTLLQLFIYLHGDLGPAHY